MSLTSLKNVIWGFGGARGSCGTGGCIVVLGFDVLSNGFLCTGYLDALSCVLFTLCCVLLKCA